MADPDRSACVAMARVHQGRTARAATGCAHGVCTMWRRASRYGTPAASPVLAGSPPGAWLGGDVFLERLYCIQWMDAADLQEGKTRPASWFAAPDDADLAREARLRVLVEESIAEWQAAGLVPDMRIEPGEKTDEPIRDAWLDVLAPPVHAAAAFAVGALQGGDGRSPTRRRRSLCFDLTFMADRHVAAVALAEWGHAGKAPTAPSADAVRTSFTIRR